MTIETNYGFGVGLLSLLLLLLNVLLQQRTNNSNEYTVYLFFALSCFVNNILISFFYLSCQVDISYFTFKIVLCTCC